MRRSSGSAAVVPPQEGSGGPAPARGQRLLLAGTAAVAIAVVVPVVLVSREQPESVPEQITAAYIDAWNQRDGQAVSGLTCLWGPAFTPAGIVEEQFADGPAVAEYSIAGTQRTTLSHREVIAVHVEYVREHEGRSREATVYVQLEDTHEPCLAALTTW
jgi:hypothetical protein